MYLNELSLLSQKSEVLPKSKGDGVAISDEGSVTLKAETEAEVLVIEVPGLIDAR